MKAEPYTLACGTNTDTVGSAQVMAYMVGPFAVHRPQYSNSGWKVSYGGMAYPGTFWTRSDALAAARLLHSAYTEGWSVQKTEEEARALEKTLNVGWRATSTIYPEADWVQRYDDYIDCVWMKGRQVHGGVEWPSWVFSD
jgi:hypothetical protein